MQAGMDALGPGDVVGTDIMRDCKKLNKSKREAVVANDEWIVRVH
jgi:hypothetical protein